MPRTCKQQNAALMAAFSELDAAAGGGRVQFTDAPLTLFRQQIERVFDPRDGGFGGAPKFPQPQMLERLLRDWRASADAPQPDLQALYMATLTLRRMAEGGINDQLGGGFCRYAVDATWMIPHFEKMLYDNGALLAVYAAGGRWPPAMPGTHASPSPPPTGRCARCSRRGRLLLEPGRGLGGPRGQVLRLGPRGGARRAHRGRVRGVRAALRPRPDPANFEGHWHLYTATPVEELARSSGRTPQQVEAWLAAARDKLLALRALRVRPARDEKVLTSWNALMIRGMAIAARALARDELADSARRALSFIRSTLWRDGRLVATYMAGKAHLNAYLDDYVYLIDALLELQQVRFRADELAFARQLLEVVLEHFEDQAGGGFYFTSDDHEVLIHRMKPFSDDAIPAGKAIAASVLLRFGHLLGEPRYLAAAERVLAAAWPALSQHPQGHATLLTRARGAAAPAADRAHPRRGAGRGGLAARAGAAVCAAPHRAWHSGRTRPACPRRWPTSPPAPGSTVAYVCRGSTCSAPLDSLGALLSELRAPEGAGSTRPRRAARRCRRWRRC